MASTFTLTGTLTHQDGVTPVANSGINVKAAPYPDTTLKVLYTRGVNFVSDANGAFSKSLIAATGLYYTIRSTARTPLFQPIVFAAPSAGSTVDLSSLTFYNPTTPPSETLIAGYAAAAAASAASLAKKKVSDLTYPMTTGHSGAGKLVFPDGSIETTRIAEAQGLPVVDCGDFRLQADGSFVSIHASVLSAITNIVGNPYNLSAAMARQIVLNPSLYYNNPPADILSLCTWEDVAREFNGRVVMTPEIKTDGSYPYAPGASGTAFLAKLQTTGMTKSVIVSAFALSELTPLLAGGVECLLNTSGDQSLGPALTAANAAWTAGVKQIAVDANTNTPAVVATLHTIGFKVWVYDIVDQYGSAAWLAGGVDVVASDDPVYTAGTVAKYRRTADAFSLGVFPAGMVPADGTPTGRGTLAYGRWFPKTGTSSTATTRWGFLSPVANAASTYTLGVTVCFDAIGSDLTRYAGIVVASSDDRYWDVATARSVNSGYVVNIRPNALNQLQVSEVVAGVTTSKSNVGPQSNVTTTGALTSGVAITSIPVVALTSAIGSGNKVVLTTGQTATLSATALVGATALTVTSITPSATVSSGSVLPSILLMAQPLTLTAGLTAGAAVTSLSVSAVPAPLAAGHKFALPSVSSTGAPLFAVLSAGAAVGATSVSVTSVTPSTAVASGATLPHSMDVTIQVTPTTIVMTRTDQALTGTGTSSAVRGGHIQAALNDNGGASGLKVSYCKVSVT